MWSSGYREKAILRKSIAAAIVTMFLLTVLPALSEEGEASSTYWESYLPSANSAPDASLSTQGLDPNGRAEVNLASNIAYIDVPTTAHPYYEIGVYCTAGADTWGKIGYNAPVTGGTANYLWPVTEMSIADEQGVWISFHSGFYFQYFGKWYSKVYVSSNGFVSFDQDCVAGSDTTWTRPSPDVVLPSTNGPDGIIAPWWRDLAGGYLDYGRGRYTALTDSFGVMWYLCRNKGYDQAYQTFGVFFENTYDVSGRASSAIKFVYGTITKPVAKVGRKAVPMPTAVGYEDQWGLRGAYLSSTAKYIAYNKQIVINPKADNSYGITSIKVSAEKYLADLSNDQGATIAVEGPFDQAPPGQNIGSPLPNYDPYSKDSSPGWWDAAGIVLTLASYIPRYGTGLGLVMDATGLLCDAAALLGHSSPMPVADLYSADRAHYQAYVLNSGVDEVTGGARAAWPYDVYTMPLFKWRIWTVAADGVTPVDPKLQDHYLFLNAEIQFGLMGGSTSLLKVSSSPCLKIVKDTAVTLWSDNFEDGSISNWHRITAGTGIVAADNTVWHDGHWSLHVSGAGQFNYARAQTPSISNWDTGKDYRLSFYFNPVATKDIEIIDDGRLELIGLVNLLACDVYAITPTMVKVGTLSVGDWHHVEIRATQGSYEVYLDNTYCGVFNCKDTWNTAKTLSFGETASAGSRDLAEGYWDELQVIGYATGTVRWTDDFEDGSVVDWTRTQSGTGYIEASTAQSYSGSWSMHVSSDGGMNGAWATSPQITTWDTTKDYRISFDFYLADCISNTDVTVVDDSRIKLVDQYLRNPPPSGPYMSMLCVDYGGMLEDVAPLSVGAWHTIEIVKTGSTFVVWLDGTTAGTIYSLYDLAGAAKTLTIGGDANRHTSYSYWDDFAVVSQ